jgi:ribosome-associated heat shock protein Hsp15
MEDDVRLDKWLWAARFYKTRSLATEAINGGKVHLNKARVKPSKKAVIGAEIRITQGFVERTVIVLAISGKRGPATVAQTLYEETEESIKKRLAQKELMKNTAATIHTQGKPNKKDRRLIHRFKSNI